MAGRFDLEREQLLRQLARVDEKEAEAEITAARLLERAEQAELRREQLRLQLEEDMIRFGDDDFEEGAVVTFSRRFPSGGGTYSYAVIKANGLWWITGRKTVPFSWALLIERHLRHADIVSLVDTVVDI